MFDDFGGHPVRGADHGGTFGFLVGQFGAEAKIGDFYVAAGVEEDVIGFDIAVDDILGVKVGEALACLPKELWCVSL